MLQVHPDPDEEDPEARVLIAAKANDCKKPPGRKYRLEAESDTGTAWVVWGGESSLNADELSQPGERIAAVDEWAGALLEATPADGQWHEQEPIIARAAEALDKAVDRKDEAQKRLIGRARERSGLDTRKRGKGWHWCRKPS